MFFPVLPALSQSVTQEQPKQPATPETAARENAARETARTGINEFSEAAQALVGPAGNPECVWLGRRVVGLMWRDDADTAFRHLDLYDRFGCPGGHIQATFRCLVRFAGVGPKTGEAANRVVHSCWVNPAAQPQPAAAAAPAAPAQPAPAK